MEVRIGVQYAPRELVIDATATAEEVEQAVTDALTGKTGTLSLTDDKGRRVVVSSEKLAYVEIAEAEGRRVGFGTL